MCYSTLMDYLVGFILFSLTNGIHAGDNLALLSGTLKTYHKTVCDSENVTLSCPRGTSISIEMAQYEKSKDAEVQFVLCPRQDDVDPATMDAQLLPTSCVHSNVLETKWQELEDTSWVRYSLLQTAIEACQKKTHCKFFPAPKSLEGNPCPGVRRLVSFSYKCRPYEFRSKVACENEIVQLTCNPYSRIAIYSASYGRTEYESIQCAQPQGVREETCLVSYATETVMKICHGRRRCALSADTGTFGNPCRSESRMYLKTVYTCVSRRVLQDQYNTDHEPDEINPDPSGSDVDIYDDDNTIPPAPKLQGNHTVQATATTTPTLQPSSASGGTAADTAAAAAAAAEGGSAPHITSSTGAGSNDAGFWMEDHEDFFYAYVALLATVLVIVCLLVVMSVRLVWVGRRRPANGADGEQRKGSGTASTMTTTTTTAGTGTAGGAGALHKKDSVLASELTEPNGLDADMEMTTPISIASISKDDDMCSTYAASAYAHLEPGSLMYTYIGSDPDKCPAIRDSASGLTSTFRASQNPMYIENPAASAHPASSGHHMVPDVGRHGTSTLHVSFAPGLTSTLGRQPQQQPKQQPQYCMGVVGDPSQYYYG